MSKLPYIIDESAGLTTMRDPMILVHDGRYYLTGTQPPYWEGVNDGVRMWSSADLEHWEDHGLILKREDMPEDLWCRDRFWAPELFEADGVFYLTFNCRNESKEHPHFHSCGIAKADKVTGPYTIMSYDESLTEHVKGDNDATMFRDDDGQIYFACAGDMLLHIYKFNSEDGSLSDGYCTNEKAKEGEWDSIGTEGQFIIKRNGIYYQWYSSWTNGYDAGVMTAKSINGPWTKSPQNPILTDNELWHMAGHNHGFRSLDGKDYLIFHAMLRDPEDHDTPRIFIREVEYLPDGTIKVSLPQK